MTQGDTLALLKAAKRRYDSTPPENRVMGDAANLIELAIIISRTEEARALEILGELKEFLYVPIPSAGTVAHLAVRCGSEGVLKFLSENRPYDDFFFREAIVNDAPNPLTSAQALVYSRMGNEERDDLFERVELLYKVFGADIIKDIKKLPNSFVHPQALRAIIIQSESPALGAQTPTIDSLKRE